jgi:oxygen-independent coproporphyrinogen-3 oxidase
LNACKNIIRGIDASAGIADDFVTAFGVNHAIYVIVVGVFLADLDRRQMEAEDLMLGMRMARGISDERLLQACAYLPEAEDTMRALQEEGYVEHADGRWRPTNQGWLCGNDLYGRLLDLAP